MPNDPRKTLREPESEFAATRAARLTSARARRRQRRVRVMLGAALTVGATIGLVEALQVDPKSASEAAILAADATDAAQGLAVPPAAAAPGGAMAVPFRTAPMSTSLGMTVPAASTPSSGAVVLTPAQKARLEVESRASRDALRAMTGARVGFARPVEGAYLTSPFGPRWGRLHAGVDYAGPIGLPIRSVAPGVVTVAGPASGYGRLVEVRHDDDTFSRYGHLHRIDVRVGQRVDPADVIGALGNAGRSTGPHLHLEIRTPAGTPINPMPWLRERGIVPVEARSSSAPEAPPRD